MSPAQLGLAGCWHRPGARHNVLDRLTKDEQRLRHAGYFVLAADGNRNICFATGDPSHGAAQQRQTADNATADIEPRNQAGGDKRGDAQDDQNDPAELDLRNCPRRERLREIRLPLDQVFDGGPQPVASPSAAS